MNDSQKSDIVENYVDHENDIDHDKQPVMIHLFKIYTVCKGICSCLQGGKD